jgi:hypothetical protein
MQVDAGGFTVSYHSQGIDDFNSNVLELRLFSHFIVDQIPATGIPELIETMLEIFDFYSDVLELRDETAILPSPKKLQAKLNAPTIRPEFPIVDEV